MKILVRHFFASLFDLGFLDEDRVSTLPRTIATSAGVMFALGLVTARIFLGRYVSANRAGLEFYQQAVMTDHVFLIAVPMWIVAFVSVLAGPSLFPDETDFRVLMAMPVSQRLVFASKLVALVLFVAVFMLIGQFATLPTFILSTISPFNSHAFPWLLVAFLAAGTLGAAFGALAIIAVHALLLLFVPRQYLLPVSAAAGSLMIFLLVIAVPFVGLLPSFEEAFASGSGWLFAFPPAWFAAVERSLLGDLRFGPLAGMAVAALAVVTLIAASAYIYLYRHFDRVMMRPAADGGADEPAVVRSRTRDIRRPALTAVRHFTLVTLRRSVLHQGILVGLAAIGAAIVATGLLNVDYAGAFSEKDWQRQDFIATVTWAPFVLIFLTSFAVRASLLVPIESRANWVFRMTERPATRADELEGAAWVLRLLGVALPVVLLLPIQWLAMGPDAFLAALLTAGVGAVLAELILLNWRRVPFTCSYIAGKGFVPTVLLKGLLAFIAFTTLGQAFARVPFIFTRTAGVAALGLLVAGALVLRGIRRRLSSREPLEFEDVLPTETNPLRLSSD